MKIGVLTSRTAKPMVEEFIGGAGLGGDLQVYDLPVHSISIMTARSIKSILLKNPGLASKLREADIILVPGTIRGDVRELGEILGRPVYKASRFLAHLPQVVRHVNKGGELDTVRPADDIMALKEPEHPIEVAFKIRGVEIPLRGPPLRLASEIPPEKPEVRGHIARLIKEGAEIIIVGVGIDEAPERAERRISLAVETGYPVLAEAPDREIAELALDHGVDGLIIGCHLIGSISHRIPGGIAIVIGEIDSNQLASGVNELREVGVKNILADPVVGVPLVDLASTIDRYKRALGLGVPLIFSSANVIEELEVDTHGAHGVLAALAVELRASVYTVVEDSYKSLHGTAEAREALRVAYRAWRNKSTQKGLYSRLLVLKQSYPPEKASREPGCLEVGYVEPKWDKRGYITVYVDHARGVVGAVYREYRGRTYAFEGRHAMSVARALIREASLDPEHAAYLGYELSKAEIALTLGKSYVQDERVITPPWVPPDEGRGD